VRRTYGILGPLEATLDDRPVALGPPKQRALLALLVIQAGEVVPTSRLVDGLWEVEPPGTSRNVLQGYVSGLRKALGKDAIATRGSGYQLLADHDSVDLARFERLAAEGSQALAIGKVEDGADALRRALEMWRGPALSDLCDEPFARTVIGRLDDLRTAAQERYLEAEIACGRHANAAVELEHLLRQHPLRERLCELQMLALYRSGRQADALDSYRALRSRLVRDLGLEPCQSLQDLEQAILRHDPALDPGSPDAGLRPLPAPTRTVLVASFSGERLGPLLELAEPLVGLPGHELVIATTVVSVSDLGVAGSRLQQARATLVGRGVSIRAAAFTSVMPGADLARLANEQNADLLLIEAPAGLLEDARLLSLLDDAPCDVGIVIGSSTRVARPVLVPFSGAEHDWAAVELGAWLARARSVALRLVGASTGADGRDASRLLANASLAVQRGLGVAAEPVIVDPTPEALLEEAREAGLVVLGLTERWRREGLGRTRTALATAGETTTVLVRRGLRPGGIAPGDGDTRFTWTLAPLGI
jgi:DNA-binding SARP family transcriptional activator